MNNNRFSRRSVLATGAAGVGAALAGCSGGGGGGSEGDTIKIGVLEDRSGNFSVGGTPKWRASKLAIEEINDNGGIMGQQIELFDPDPQSDNQRYQQLTERLIQQEEVDALWGGYSSATREAIRPIIDREDQLYFYTNQYEGGVADKNVYCMGPTPRQQFGTVIPYMIENFGTDIYTFAADYNFGQLSADWVKVIAQENGASVNNEEFIPLSNRQFGSTITNIEQADPDFVMALLAGKNHSSFWNQRASAGLDIPMATSTVMAQTYEHNRFEPPALADVYGSFSYMEEIPTDRNEDYVSRYYDRWPDAGYANQESVNSYFSFYLYKKAVEEAGTTDQEAVKEVLNSGMEVTGDRSPEGDIRLQGPVHHMAHNVRIMKCDSNHNITVEDEQMMPEQFLSETVGIDLSGPDSELEKQFTPANYFDAAGQ